MTIGARYGRLNLFGCVLFVSALFVSALMFAAEALAAPRAAELGPEMPLAEPAAALWESSASRRKAVLRART